MKSVLEQLRGPPEPATTRAQPSVSAADVGLLLIRLAVGLVMAGHGAQKLFGLFGGHGLVVTGKGFAALGYHPGWLYAIIGGGSEFLGGLGLALGLLTPLAAAALVGVMLNAIVTVTSAHGLWETHGGMEYNLCIMAVAVGIAAIGPGRLALDRPFRWGRGGWGAAAVALALGGLGASVVLIL
ncbi:DoxX family protein [Kitasatospora aureofaciens]|uniref:DoxX family protein n=1 Tax=Kitasatospora aureofaciens TaxID=1894 RepID=UPI001C497200|nr:DoxX family protein [Kitasatospora aureofaciens]